MAVASIWKVCPAKKEVTRLTHACTQRLPACLINISTSLTAGVVMSYSWLQDQLLTKSPYESRVSSYRCQYIFQERRVSTNHKKEASLPAYDGHCTSTSVHTTTNLEWPTIGLPCNFLSAMSIFHFLSQPRKRLPKRNSGSSRM